MLLCLGNLRGEAKLARVSLESLYRLIWYILEFFPKLFEWIPFVFHSKGLHGSLQRRKCQDNKSKFNLYRQ